MREIELDFSATLSALEETAKCPIDWDESLEYGDLTERMIGLWHSIVLNRQVRLEASWAIDPEKEIILQVDPDSLPEMQADLFNIRSWIQSAADDYIERTRRFWNLRMLNTNEYQKHFPFKEHSRQQLKDLSSKSKISIFFPGASPDLHYWALISGLDSIAAPDTSDEGGSARSALWNNILTCKDIRIAFQAKCPIGVVGQIETPYISFDINASQLLAHAYPVTEQEANRIMSGVSISVLDLESNGATRRVLPHRPLGKLRLPFNLGNLRK